MRWKLFAEFCLTVLAISIIAGDLFLPEPYRNGSQELKANINHFLISLIPRKEPLKIESPPNFSLFK